MIHYYLLRLENDADFQAFIEIIQYVPAVLILAGIILLIYQIRWYTPKVFLSYNNEQANIMMETAAGLQKANIKTDYVPYQKADHDKIVIGITEKIRAADVILCFPGNRNESNFTDAELFSSLSLGKNALLIANNSDHHLPNTALTEYEVINYHASKTVDHKLLALICKIYAKHFTYILPLIPFYYVFTIFGFLMLKGIIHLVCIIFDINFRPDYSTGFSFYFGFSLVALGIHLSKFNRKILDKKKREEDGNLDGITDFYMWLWKLLNPALAKKIETEGGFYITTALKKKY